MKKMFGLLSLALISLNSMASEAPAFYRADFRVNKVSPICPSKPGQISCMAIGSHITLKAMYGCVDKVVFSDATVVQQGSKTIVYAVSLVKRSPDSDRVRCIRANEIVKQVYSGSAMIASDVEVVNIDIEQY